MADSNQNITLNKVEARQGTTKPKLIYVLAAGLALVIVAFTVAALFYHP